MFLISTARHTKPGRRALMVVLIAYFLGGLPLVLNFHTWGAPWIYWKSLSARFTALPLP